ncbi:FAD/NAD(P)-binding domain-containing protein [Aspergillus sclerotiicarbonarius CBS 121057]|uniref:FAD/NAD(P)-binding domain-containing protein n=1 Tax=Aspergillus sclerotiicarbonarius (strain CBS 121057 / IBT 28362) TaxID=1448318 RepID=A0A319EYC3_ASPSB|nr:FAD/NAD(P)-binding domain-containing protein [Aspergillus sclerotiicarbonarius CBS 121057]
MPHSIPQEKHILIIGAGLTGLILAQALRHLNHLHSTQPQPQPPKYTYTYTIYERDPYAFARGAGWSLTIHWALTDLRNILPPDILARFHECLVNPGAADRGIAGNFQYLDLRTGRPKEKWAIPWGAASRVSREKLLALLMEGVDIQWNKHLTSITTTTNPTSTTTTSTITAHFIDHTTATGSLLIGCDGSRSTVRRHLTPTPTLALPSRLPIRLLGLRVPYPITKIAKCEALDVHFFQGGDPLTNVYFWFSFIYLPRPEDRYPEGKGETEAVCQMMMSWPFEKGGLRRGKNNVGEEEEEGEGMEAPGDNAGRLALMKELANEWAEPMREMVMDLPDDTDVREIVLEDWVPGVGRWGNQGGRATLVGDAAHGMTMFRGEAANHGVIDVSVLVKLLAESAKEGSELELEDVVNVYEKEMIQRTQPAVLKSRQACLDAHRFDRVDGSSPLISRRAMKD